MAEGTSEVLTASILPEEASDQTIEWSSANPKIASVTDKGEVKALKTGKAVITATTADGGYEASCRVTVHTPPPVVKLDRESAQIHASGDDSAVQLNASVTGSEFWDEEDVMWESSAPSVAEVDDSGLVTGRAPGTAWILANCLLYTSAGLSQSLKKYKVGSSIKSLKRAKPGDILLFKSGGRYSHAGIYSGNGKLIHAANARKGVVSQSVRQLHNSGTRVAAIIHVVKRCV